MFRHASRLRARAAVAIALVLAVPGVPAAAESGGVDVQPVAWSLNGQETVPVGLFGVHHMKLTPQRIEAHGITTTRKINWSLRDEPAQPPEGIEMYIECFFDRYQPALVLTRDDWKQALTGAAKSYGENARGVDRPCCVEFWNEPYLNWACKPGVNYDGKFYDRSNPKVGGRMTIKGRDEPTEHLVWAGKRKVAYRRGQVDYVATRYMPDDVEAGSTWKRGSREYEVIERWWGRDPTQKHYWSGRQNVLWYLRMFEPFARTLKQTNPDVTVLGGWGFNIFNEGWDSWRRLYRPLIDRCHRWMDGIHEHHYGGDTRRVAGSYEVAYAYALGKYGKRLRFFNTEAGGMLDPEQPRPHPGLRGSLLEQARGSMTYLLRDVIYMIATCPDKAASRAAHQWYNSTPGDLAALKLLKPLRGALLRCTSSIEGVWAAAALAPGRRRICVVAFNDNDSGPTAVPLAVTAPKGTAFRSGTAYRVAVEDGELSIRENELKVRGGTFRRPGRMAPNTAHAIVLELSAPAKLTRRRVEKQFVSGEVVRRLEKGRKLELSIEVPDDVLASASDARLRLVLEGASDRAADVKINGQLHRVRSPRGPIVEIPLGSPRQVLRAANRIVVEAKSDCLFGAASLIVAADEPAGR